MSENWIVFIPEDLGALPTDVNQKQILEYLGTCYPAADDIKVALLPELQFFDCGSNFESIACPACNTRVDVAIWQDWMDEDYTGLSWNLHFRNLDCCRQKVNLHTLRYNFPQGFAVFAIEIGNPGLAEVPAEVLTHLEKQLGLKLRIIFSHI